MWLPFPSADTNMAETTSGLLPSQIAEYRERGFLTGLPALSPTELPRFRAQYLAYEAEVADDLDRLPPRQHRYFFAHTHLFLGWVLELATRPAILDAVESLLGHDLLIWGSQWFVKRPRDSGFITWHQDAEYWALDPPELCTAWIALTQTSRENGCLTVIPGSHREPLPHRPTESMHNALSLGQEIVVDVDETKACPLELAPGEMSLHDIRLAHSSKANSSATPRIGLAVRFVPAHVRPGRGSERAVLVRGTNRFGYFEAVECEGDPDRELAKRRATAYERVAAPQ